MRRTSAGLHGAIWIGGVVLLIGLPASLLHAGVLEAESAGDPDSGGAASKEKAPPAGEDGTSPYINWGDEIAFKDGKTLQGTLLEILPAEYVFWTEGTKQFIPRGSVEFVERAIDRSFVAFFKKRQSEAKTLKDWRNLGEFSRKKGAYPELRACMREILELDPKDEEAHRDLGEALLDGAWVGEKEVQAKLEAGYELREGKLVKKLDPGKPAPRPKKEEPAKAESKKPAKPEKAESAKAEKKEPGKPAEKATEKSTDKAKEKPAEKPTGKASESPGQTIVKKEEKKEPKPTPAATATRKTSKSIKSVDFVQKVLADKDPHALWMLLSRSGVMAIIVDRRPVQTTLASCKAVIDVLSAGGKYEEDMKKFLATYGAPRDWVAANKKKVEEFKKQHPKGIHYETKFYHVLSTASPEVTKTLGQSMDIVTAQVYHKIFEFDERIPHKYVLIFWGNRQQFIRNGGSPGAGAYFSPATKELVGFDMNADGQSSMDPCGALFHEGWHQYFDFYIPNAPRWYDEGFAEQVYPTIVKGGKAIWTGFNRYRAVVVTDALKRNKLIPLRDLIKMSHAEFYSPANVGIAYSQAWSFIYFLTTYTHQDKALQSRVRNFYKDYFWELHKGTDPAEAVDIVFKEVKFDTLETAWLAAVPNQK